MSNVHYIDTSGIHDVLCETTRTDEDAEFTDYTDRVKVNYDVLITVPQHFTGTPLDLYHGSGVTMCSINYRATHFKT